jgi:lipase chaperone LimK
MYHNQFLYAAHHIISGQISIFLLFVYLLDYFLGTTDYTPSALNFLFIHQIVDKLLYDLLSLLILVAVD